MIALKVHKQKGKQGTATPQSTLLLMLFTKDLTVKKTIEPQRWNKFPEFNQFWKWIIHQRLKSHSKTDCIFNRCTCTLFFRVIWTASFIKFSSWLFKTFVRFFFKLTEFYTYPLSHSQYFQYTTTIYWFWI